MCYLVPASGILPHWRGGLYRKTSPVDLIRQSWNWVKRYAYPPRSRIVKCVRWLLCVWRMQAGKNRRCLSVRPKNPAGERRTVAVVRVVGDPMRVLLHRRADTGLLAGLWELPNVLADKADLLPSALDKVAVYKRSLPSGKHVFSHVEWHMTGALYDMPNGQLPPDYRAVTLEELVEKYALPIAFRTYAAWLPQLLEGDG